MKNEKLYSAIFREKPVELLIKMLNTKNQIYASVIAKEINCTYSHVVKLLKILEKENLIKFEKQGRLKYLTLTEKGEKLAESLQEAKEIISSK